MAKFGKSFRKKQVTEWEDNYLNYKSLKQKVKQIKSNIGSQRNESILINDALRKANINNDLASLYLLEDGNLLKEFIELLDKELKKVYVFFSTMEKELYKKINLHLHIKQSYPTFTLKDIHAEVVSLWFTIYLALSLLRFINDNMTALKNILKKFDKKFNAKFGFISYKYLTQKLSNSNSDLEYLLHFKIIDETSAITESLTKSLKTIFKQEGKHPIEAIGWNENGTSIQKEEELIENLSPQDVIAHTKKKFKEVKNYVTCIDESNQFRIQYRELMSYINHNDKITKNSPETLYNDIYNPLMSCTLVNDSIMEKFISWNIQSSIKYHEANLSYRNKVNIALCFMHTFLYNILYTCILPTNYAYLNEIKWNSFYCGVVFSMVPLFSIFSELIFHKIIRKQIKFAMIISYVLFCAGSLTYALDYKLKSFYVMLLGRCFIGLGSSPFMSKTYITTNASKYYLPYLSKLYLTMSGFAMFIGILIGHYSAIDLFGEKSIIFVFNKYTNIGWIGVFLSLILLIISLIFFTEPNSSRFTMINTIDENDDIDCNQKLTFSNVPFLSEEEKVMISQIDTKLNQFNEENNFTNINKIPNELNAIAQREESGFHYFSKNIIIIVSLLFTVRLLNEGLLVRPINVKPDLTPNHYAWLLMGIYFIQIFPYCFVNQLSYHNRNFKYSLIFALFLCVAASIVFWIYLSSDLIYYMVIAMLCFLSTIIEISTCSLISLILPPKWSWKSIRASSIIPFALTIGKVVSTCLMTLIGLFFNLHVYYYIILGFSYAVFIFLIILLFIYTDFRVKAIAKILRNQITNKMMMET